MPRQKTEITPGSSSSLIKVIDKCSVSMAAKLPPYQYLGGAPHGRCIHPVSTRAECSLARRGEEILMGKSTFLAALVLATGVLTWADTPRLGDEIELRARHHLGVPLHRLPESTNDFDRVPDGAHAIVREIQDDADWFRLEIADGRGGWIVKRYIGRVIAGTEPTETQDAELVWSSLEGCQQVVEANRRKPKEDPNALLVGSWNIRWFARDCSTNEDCPEKHD
jgi:hypothetical protein